LKEKKILKKAVKWIKEFPYELGERYVKAHASSNESGFKFGFDKRSVCKKPAINKKD